MIVKVIGVKRVMRYLPPVVTGPIIICIGLSLAPSAISNASQNWILALIALGTVIFFNIWGVGMFRIIPILMGIVVSYVVALIMNALGMTNADGSAILSFAGVASAPIVGVPKFFLCKFNITAILAMAPIAIASMMEHIGDISAISATVDRNFIEDPGLHRTLLGDGLATLSVSTDRWTCKYNLRREHQCSCSEPCLRPEGNPSGCYLCSYPQLYPEDG